MRMYTTIKRCLFLASATVALSLLSQTPVWSMGMGWGDIGGGSAGKEACTAEENIVIKPGAMGAPVRLLDLDEETILVADYSRYAIDQVLKNDTSVLQKLFDTRQETSVGHGSSSGNIGKPLSVAVRKWRRGDVYFVGNDDLKTVDLYWVYDGKVKLFKRLFEKNNVQAVDMYLSKEVGKLFVVDGLNNDVKVVDYRGRVRQKIGGFGALIDPKGVAYDWLNKEVLITDYGDPKLGISASIQIFSSQGQHLKTITGAFSRPQGIDASGGKIYVTDAMLGQVLEIDRSNGEVLKTYGCLGTNEGHLLLPMDVVVDETTQTLYVADSHNGRVTALTMNTQP